MQRTVIRRFSVLFLSAVSGRDSVSSRRKRNSVDRSLIDRFLVFSVYQCYYPKCITPTFTPLPSPEVSLGPDTLQTPANFTYV